MKCAPKKKSTKKLAPQKKATETPTPAIKKLVPLRRAIGM
jgi:hypothetical protein